MAIVSLACLDTEILLMHSLLSVFHDDIQCREGEILMIFSKTKTIYKRTLGKILK